MKAERYLAFDLGAESGRAVAGAFDGERLTLEEVHRFPNGPVRVPLRPRGAGMAAGGEPREALYWDALALWREIKAGLATFRSRYGAPASLGIDAWGVDYALLGEDGALLGNPYNHRDARTAGMVDEAIRRVPKEAIFERTGIQFMQINTLYQLLAETLLRSPILEAARSLVMIPDLFAYWLTGRVACEFTNATTTQAYDPRAPGWATDLLSRLGLRTDIFPEVVAPGTRLGTLLAPLADEMGLPPTTRVTAVASHDTGSAVAAIPTQSSALRPDETFAYISSGTWSLVGGEVPEPVITPDALRYNFTNEGGVGGFRLLKNVMGLWLVQECRRTWQERGHAHSYAELAGLAARATPFSALVDPDDASFLSPGDMPQRLATFCARTGQEPLAAGDEGQVVRCVLESLAFKYRWVIERLERLTGKRVAVIHVVGGGSQNALLNQLTADACRRPVRAGPVEATALGNILVQAIAGGRLGSLAEGRDLIHRSFPEVAYEPQATVQAAHDWNEAYDKFQSLIPAAA